MLMAIFLAQQHAGESHAGKLAALVGVENLWLAVARERFLQRLDAKVGVHRDRHPTSSWSSSMKPVLRRPVESAQYLAMNYTQRPAEAKLVPSVGSVGDSYDNALAETINGLYKAEVIWRQRSWPSASAVEMATLNWVEWFNYHRLFGPIGYIPPAEAEANYYATLKTLDMVA